MKVIKVNIDGKGNVEMDAQGFKGKQCEEVTDKLKLLLGGEAEDTKKPDYYAPPQSTAQTIKKDF